jgi:hypothetical protein
MATQQVIFILEVAAEEEEQPTQHLQADLGVMERFTEEEAEVDLVH